jgi:aminoglycoside phosphotransferase (APT) family kinase protein
LVGDFSTVLIEIIQKNLPNEELSRADLIQSGIMSNVYRIHLVSGKTLVAKLVKQETNAAVEYEKAVFNRNEGKWYQLIEQQQNDIPHPKLFYASKIPEKEISHFLLLEDVDMLPVSKIRQQLTSQDKSVLASDVGETLGKIHSFQIDPIEKVSPRAWAKAFMKLFNNVLNEVERADPSNTLLWSTCKKHFLKYQEQMLSLSKVCLVHGDFTAHNVLVNLNSNHYYRKLSIIDWEWATIGDPNLDFAGSKFGMFFHTNGRLVDSPENYQILWRSYKNASLVYPEIESWERQEIYMLFYLLAPLLVILKIKGHQRAMEDFIKNIIERVTQGDLEKGYLL